MQDMLEIWGYMAPWLPPGYTYDLVERGISITVISRVVVSTLSLVGSRRHSIVTATILNSYVPNHL